MNCDSSDSSIPLEDICAKGNDFDDSDEFDIVETMLPPSSSDKKKEAEAAAVKVADIANLREKWKDEKPSNYRWERQSEFDAMDIAECFSAPLSNKPADIWPDADNDDLDALLHFKTPEGLLGKMMVHKIQAKKIRVKWTTSNTIFPGATLAPYCEEEMVITLIDHNTEGDRLQSFLDLSLGGYAWDPRTFRQAQRSKAPGEHVLPPALGFMLHNDRFGTPNVPFLFPCRGTLVYMVQTPSAVGRLLKVSQEAVMNDEDVFDNMLGRFYDGLRRRAASVTHFTEGQVEQLWSLFVEASETGEEDIASGVEVFLSLERLPVFLKLLLPAADLTPEDNADDDYIASLQVFLESRAFQEGLWWLLSDPLRTSYNMTPTSKRVNRVIRFSRVAEVLNIAMFGVKESICEFIVQLMTPNKTVLSRADMQAFFASTFEGEDVAELVGTFDDMFIDEHATLAMVRQSLFEMDVFQTWSALIHPLLVARDWKRQNPDL
eukprot:TRINITY_DN3775_c1_g1_i1.p1 TRINITY_DN3775_c1_g1~~TRINITY_DN3775_c1_g1_i1.p1  ORF type:complete len:490 (+),score=139.50 TRINITY_DN3775_c1_g1_i1:1366-2835(+)